MNLNHNNTINLELAHENNKKIYQLVRHLRKDEYCLKHRLLSIAEDQKYIEAVKTICGSSHWQVFSNLRCGKWYTQLGSPTCYFKVKTTLIALIVSCLPFVFSSPYHHHLSACVFLNSCFSYFQCLLMFIF